MLLISVYYASLFPRGTISRFSPQKLQWELFQYISLVGLAVWHRPTVLGVCSNRELKERRLSNHGNRQTESLTVSNFYIIITIDIHCLTCNHGNQQTFCSLTECIKADVLCLYIGLTCNHGNRQTFRSLTECIKADVLCLSVLHVTMATNTFCSLTECIKADVLCLSVLNVTMVTNSIIPM